jgi:hypothetical protein
VKGSAIRARVNWAKEQGVAEYARFLNELSNPTRVAIDQGLSALGWYPFDMFVEVLSVLDAQFGKGDLELCYDLGRYACDANLRTLYRFLFKVGNIHFIIRRAASAWRINYDEGELKVLQEGPSSVVLQIRDWPQPHRAHCLSVKGWIVEAGHISGREVKSCHEKCKASGDEVCELAIEWHEPGQQPAEAS